METNGVDQEPPPADADDGRRVQWTLDGRTRTEGPWWSPSPLGYRPLGMDGTLTGPVRGKRSERI